LKDELSHIGITPISEHADCENYDAMMYKLQIDPEIGAVIIGHDSNWTYNSSVLACIYLASGVKFIATDDQSSIKLRGGRRIPSTKALTDSVCLGLSDKNGGQSYLNPEIVGLPGLFLSNHLKRHYTDKKVILLGSECDYDLSQTEINFK
jgi:ribonucleotide monophosphatase NagD (HAD superfamily)